MKLLYTLFLVLLITIVSTAQTSDVRQLSSFKGVKVVGSIDVYLKKGASESAKVEVSGIGPGDVLTEVSGGNLGVRLRDGNFRGPITVKVYVTYVNLERISAAASSNIFSEGAITADLFDIAASSSASVELTVEAGDMTVNVSSSGDAALEGKARTISLKASSSASIEAGNLECEKVDATAASGARAKIMVTKSLKAEANTGGSIRYRGNPTSSNTDSQNGGSVQKYN